MRSGEGKGMALPPSRRGGGAMGSVAKNIFKAIHEGKWLSIEYSNKEGEITRAAPVAALA